MKEIKSSHHSIQSQNLTTRVDYVEPNGPSKTSSEEPSPILTQNFKVVPEFELDKTGFPANSAGQDNILKGKIQVLGNYIDTDAVCTITLA